MAEPVTATNEGVNIRPELMEKEHLYHCIFGDKLMLFFKDHQDFLNCYEIEEKNIVNQAKSSSKGEIEKILEEYVRDRHLND